MDAKAKALLLCQKVGASTMFSDFNDGMSLPLEAVKKIVIICIEEFCPLAENYLDVINEVKKL